MPLHPSEPVCIREVLSESEREDIRLACERVFAEDVDAKRIRSTDERVEEALIEAEAMGRRRAMAEVRPCPHCGGAVSWEALENAPC